MPESKNRTHDDLPTVDAALRTVMKVGFFRAFEGAKTELAVTIPSTGKPRRFPSLYRQEQ